MHYLAVASDFDGTLAHDGVVAGDVVAALSRCRDSGRKLILVTGRELADLKSVFPPLALFDYVVAENGGTLYAPATERERALADPPPDLFVRALRARHVEPLSTGRVIVATWSPHETTILEVIRDLGLELHVIFNKGAVMVLPSGINKATGLAAALAELEIPPQKVVAIGDAENDHALLEAAGIGVAVANGVPMLRQKADLVTVDDHGKGVIEVVNRLLDNDLADVIRHRPF